MWASHCEQWLKQNYTSIAVSSAVSIIIPNRIGSIAVVHILERWWADQVGVVHNLFMSWCHAVRGAESLLVRLRQASVGPGGGAAQASYSQGGKGEKGEWSALVATGFTLWPILPSLTTGSHLKVLERTPKMWTRLIVLMLSVLPPACYLHPNQCIFLINDPWILDCIKYFVHNLRNCLVAISYLLLPINVSKRIMYV